jgi:hypothetical protein
MGHIRSQAVVNSGLTLSDLGIVDAEIAQICGVAIKTHWPCLFPQHGPGHKHERPIVLEPWQAAIVEQHPGRFLRGLFHSDGCRITNWTERLVAGERKRYEYPRYFFSNRSEDILPVVRVGAGPARRRASSFERLEHLRRTASVATLDEHVGPKS